MNSAPAKPITTQIEHPLTLVDVGSSGGIASMWRRVKHLTVVEFEPDQRAADPARDWPARRILLRTPLWESPGEMDFYLTTKQQTSSLYRPDDRIFRRYPKPERVEVKKTVRTRVDTLANQLGQAGIERVDFIKLDTQGAELPILRGAEEILRQTVMGLEIEVEFLPLYKGQPLFAEVDAYVRSLGFELFELRPTTWNYAAGADLPTRGQIAFADAVYFRNPRTLRSMEQMRSLAALAELFNRPDFAAYVRQFNLEPSNDR